MTAFPHVKRVEICFIEKPTIDFNLRPLKGLDLMDVSHFFSQLYLLIIRIYVFLLAVAFAFIIFLR